MGAFKFKRKVKKKQMDSGYEIKLPEKVARDLKTTITNLQALKSREEAILTTIMAMSGHDAQEPHGQIAVDDRPEGSYLVVAPAPGPRAVAPQAPEPAKGFRPGKHSSKANGAPSAPAKKEEVTA